MDIENFDIKHRTFTLNNELYRFNKFIESTATDIHHVISRKERDKFFVIYAKSCLTFGEIAYIIVKPE